MVSRENCRDFPFVSLPSHLSFPGSQLQKEKSLISIFCLCNFYFSYFSCPILLSWLELKNKIASLLIHTIAEVTQLLTGLHPCNPQLKIDLVHLLYQLAQLSSCPNKILFVPYLNDQLNDGKPEDHTLYPLPWRRSRFKTWSPASTTITASHHYWDVLGLIIIFQRPSIDLWCYNKNKWQI